MTRASWYSSSVLLISLFCDRFVYFSVNDYLFEKEVFFSFF